MSKNKLGIFLDLMHIVENGFIYKLKQKKPEISEEEIKIEVRQWYLTRPDLQRGNPDCQPGDLTRFLK